jgi:hypothetical protein
MLYGHATSDGTPALLLEYIDGKPLSELEDDQFISQKVVDTGYKTMDLK